MSVVSLREAPERAERREELLGILEEIRTRVEAGELESFLFVATRWSGGSHYALSSTSNFHARLGALELLKQREIASFLRQNPED